MSCISYLVAVKQKKGNLANIIQHLCIFVWMDKELKDSKNIWFKNVSCASQTDGTCIVISEFIKQWFIYSQNAKYIFLENL